MNRDAKIDYVCEGICEFDIMDMDTATVQRMNDEELDKAVEFIDYLWEK